MADRGPKARAYNAQYYKDHAAQYTVWRREHRQAHPELNLLYGARVRAARQGVPFSITAEDILPIPSVCPLTGILITQGNGKVHAGSPTLDKIRPELGYVPGNVQVISYKANTMKNDATPEQLLKFAAWINKEFG